MTYFPHELTEEFPEFAGRIHVLKDTDAHFHRLANEYQEINKQIVLAEQEVQPTDDFHLEDMRKLRLKLKDEIFGMLRV